MSKAIRIILILTFIASKTFGQKFERLAIEEIIKSSDPILFRQILPTTKGTVLMATSLSNLAEVDKMSFALTWATGYPVDNKGRKVINSGRSDVFRDLFDLNSGIKLIAEGPGIIVYFVTDNNHIGFINYVYGKNAFGFPPFIFPENRDQQVDIKKIWLDEKGNLFVGTNLDTLYVIEDAANINVMEGKKWIKSTYETGFDKDSNIIVTRGIRKIKKIFLGKGVVPCSFSQNYEDEDWIYIGTNKGLFKCDPSSGESARILGPEKDESLTITHIITSATSAFTWLSTLEKGIGRYTFGFNNPVRWFPYDKGGKNSISTFCLKSATEFFIAPLDSTPAVFNTESGAYNFFIDTSFKESKNISTDIKVDNAGNLYLIKGEQLFIAREIESDPFFAGIKLDSTISQVMILDVVIGKNSYSFQDNYEVNNKVTLKYYENDISILYSARGFKSKENLEFAWKLEGRDTGWSIMPYSMMDEKLNGAYFSHLDPGEYRFIVKVRKVGEDWRQPAAILYLIIKPPFWRIWWFWLLVIGGISTIVYIVTTLRANAVRRQEREKAKHEKEVLELEAKALRAQMNPHFIFNCLNSIKSLIQDDQKDRAVTYLTTFSKLIRTLFNNADKKEISLYDEIETCKLYLQLEAMRFDSKFVYHFHVDDSIDLKSISVPALIIQPFIENAIWHGIVPKGSSGNVTVQVNKGNNSIIIVVDDNGIGRESSLQNKGGSAIGHQSKGVNLTKSRLELDNLLQQRNAKLETIDKKDENGKAGGTKVIITLPCEA